MWREVCLGKESSGLGVQQLREFNPALLGKWCWRMLVDKSGMWYRVLVARGAYEFLTAQDAQDTAATSPLIWHKQVPLKVSVMVWRLLCNRFPSKDNLVRRNSIHPDAGLCVTCCGVWRLRITCFSHVQFFHPCGASFDLGLVSLRLIRYRFAVTSFSSFIRRAGPEHSAFSCSYCGYVVSGWFGMNEIT
jgi:hypothetical protein